jgi:hypothetical protein
VGSNPTGPTDYRAARRVLVAARPVLVVNTIPSSLYCPAGVPITMVPLRP